MSPKMKSPSGNIDVAPAAEPAGATAETAATIPLVVGIGASAGGLEALEHFFAVMPPDCGLSYVVIMHLLPEGPAFLPAHLRRYTTMAVVTAAEGMPLAANTVHVLTGGWDLTLENGHFKLAELAPALRPHHPIDRFFASLAEELAERAIAVVLSGSGTDGAAGVKKIREAGGIVLAQDPESALSPGMPRSTIATGAADFVLSTEQLPEKIAAIAHGTCALPPRTCQTNTLDEELQTICSLVKTGTTHDFSSYKTNTLLRRIERRMAVRETGGFGKYIALLQQDPLEAKALCQDILIGVTSFFRDPEAFAILRQQVIPRLFADRAPDEAVRIWHACCATGEEVYSAAMLIREYLDEQKIDVKVQIFATDIDETAISQARAGLYPDDINADVGEERLKRFFTRVDHRWQVAKGLREMVIFAHHNLLKDPPFSRLDLLVCRNFLIYVNPDMQQRLIPLFHQVLKPGGVLFLGSAETVGRHAELFTPVDKKWKIFAQRERRHRSETLFPFTASIRRPPGIIRPSTQAGDERTGPGAVAEKLLMKRYSPPCVVVNEKYEVVYVSTRMGRFLELPVGEPTRNILRMAREELRPPLRAAIYKAFAEEKEVVFRGVKVAMDGGKVTVNVQVEPLHAPPHGRLAMVVFAPAPPAVTMTAVVGAEEGSGNDTSRETLIRQLEEQLRITHEQLQAVSEQLESSNEGFMAANEELMSINEEFQSANEELQSTNEELETSKEELQALNEELATLNGELQGKVEELDQINNDMENLLASGEIATLFLDQRLIIKRFTPAMAAIFNLIPADIGRPFRHLTGTIDWSEFQSDAIEVLEKQHPIEREVTALASGRHYLLRLLPYLASNGIIDGVVVTLVDLTTHKRAEEAVYRAKEEWERTFNSVPDLIAIMDDQHRVVRVNRAMAQRLGLPPEECVGLPCYAVIHGTETPPAFCPHTMTLADSQEHEAEVSEDALGGDFLVSTTPLLDAAGKLIGTVHVARDITRRKQGEQALRDSEERLNRAQKIAHLGSWELDLVKNRLTWSDEVYRIFGLQPQEFEATYEAFLAAIHPDDRAAVDAAYSASLREGRDTYEIEHRVIRKSSGEVRIVLEKCEHLRDGAGQIIRSIGMVHDITERKRVKEELQQAKEVAETATRTKSQFLANMSHELRTPMTGVLGMLDLALAGNLEEKQRECIETAQTSARSLVRILNDILDLTKIEMGKLALEENPFPLRKCVKNTFSLFLPVARSKGLDLRFTVADEVPETLVGDQTRLSQILTNLVGNAIKFTEKGEVELRVTADDCTAGGKRDVTFTVTDSGIGIPDDKQDLLFRVFSQVDASHSREYGGTGLGLAISKELVERMGGTITFTSKAGQGSAFSCTIPLGVAEAEQCVGCAAETRTPAGETRRAGETGRARLLIAEDDQIISQILKTLLQRSNYDLDFVDNGQKAVEMWESGEYDLILMDVQMPRLNGFEATAAIRAKESGGSHIPIIAMTAHALKEDEERCLAAGMDAYISKPIDFEKCLQVVGEILRQKSGGV